MKSHIGKPLTSIHKIPAAKLLWLLWTPCIFLLVLSAIIFFNRSGRLDLYSGPWNLTGIQPTGEASSIYYATTGLPEWNSTENEMEEKLLEDGRPMPGTGWVPPEELSRLESGQYSFREDKVYFSTSDKSDPRSNGRKYSIRKPLRIGQRWAIYTYSISTLLLFICIVITCLRLHSGFSLKTEISVIVILFTLSGLIIFISVNFYDARLFPEPYENLWQREVVTKMNQYGSNAFSFSRNPPKERAEQAYSVGVLKENGRTLGPGNTIHETISKHGRGSFSIWKDLLIFSSSDNSDPRRNGRVYELFTPSGRDNLTIGLGFLTFSNLLILISIMTVFRGSRRYNAGPESKLKYLTIPWILILGVQIFLTLPYEIHSRIRTWRYIRNFDVAKVERKGTDFCSIDFGENVHINRVNKIRQMLGGVSRSQALRGIFEKVTAGAANATQRHLQIAKFLQRTTIHQQSPPTYPNESEILDPLVLLELNEMWCNQASKLAIDLFEAGGYKGRQVQLGTHLVAEIYYDNSWHYLDADLFGNGEVVLTDQGTIPSIIELGTPPMVEKLNALAAYQEFLTSKCISNSPSDQTPQTGGLPYPSFFYFSRQAYLSQPESPGYYYKDTPITYADSHTFYYGWMDFHFEPDPSIIRSDLPIKLVPLAPKIENLIIDRHSGQVTISYRSTDPDQDLAGYRIYVSERPRGWNYNQFLGRPDLMKYQSTDGKWSPDNYDSLFNLPASDVALIEVTADKNETTIPLRGKKRVFISIMPFDEYGKSIGRRLFPLSSELKIELE